ncbi:MAG TPA: sigma-70 family RNA polymerase sigma factor [Streptosporangiaceae bacterium]|nr:sigma-70 family RNA polymerase sigma factor [Streptosporangiaceae bacterium]
MTTQAHAEDLLRELAPQVLGALLRRHGELDLCEDAVQEALLEAAITWPKRGLPDNPRAWLITVATRRLIDLIRAEHARRGREERFAFGAPPAEVLRIPGEDVGMDRDDSLMLMLLCCHPALTAPSQIALTLRAVGGLTTAEIASAFFVPEATMAQRISRAKQRIRDAGATFAMPPARELDARLAAVMHVLYLIFNEGYTAPSRTPASDPETQVELTTEAIRLTRQLYRLRPEDTEISGLLALMLLTEARRPGRLTPGGDLVDLAEQDRTRWNRALIDEGVELITGALASGPVGAYQLQAAIAAVHDEAAGAEDTDWPQIMALYLMLDLAAPNPMATLSLAVAVAHVRGPLAGLDVLATLDDDARVVGHHRLFAVRGHLLEMAGDRAAAREAFQGALRRTASTAEKRYLRNRIDHLT